MDKMSDTPAHITPDETEAERRLMEKFETPGEPGKETRVFRYRTPKLERPKGILPLAKSDILYAAVQLIQKGGENNLHSHAAMDGLWFVLKGRARFYGAGDALLAELGPSEGIFIPRGVSYWFESASDELLELLQVEAFAKGVKNTRTDHEPKKAGQRHYQLFSSGGAPVISP
jgi:mannose-6-phosphate isomerase-like protein (cupin superfamily)